MIRKRKRGVTGLEVFGPNYTFKASTVYDYSDKSRDIPRAQ